MKIRAGVKLHIQETKKPKNALTISRNYGFYQSVLLDERKKGNISFQIGHEINYMLDQLLDLYQLGTHMRSNIILGYEWGLECWLWANAKPSVKEER
jgi:hypothetical protein